MLAGMRGMYDRRYGISRTNVCKWTKHSTIQSIIHNHPTKHKVAPRKMIHSRALSLFPWWPCTDRLCSNINGSTICCCGTSVAKGFSGNLQGTRALSRDCPSRKWGFALIWEKCTWSILHLSPKLINTRSQRHQCASAWTRRSCDRKGN